MLQRRTMTSTVNGLRCIRDYECQPIQPSETYTQPHLRCPTGTPLNRDGGDGRLFCHPISPGAASQKRQTCPHIYSVALGEIELRVTVLASSVALNDPMGYSIRGSDRRKSAATQAALLALVSLIRDMRWLQG